jgi:hypothetical protein
VGNHFSFARLYAHPATPAPQTKSPAIHNSLRLHVVPLLVAAIAIAVPHATTIAELIDFILFSQNRSRIAACSINLGSPGISRREPLGWLAPASFSGTGTETGRNRSAADLPNPNL